MAPKFSLRVISPHPFSGLILSIWNLLGHPPEGWLSSGAVAAKTRHDRWNLRTLLSVCVSIMLNVSKYIPQ